MAHKVMIDGTLHEITGGVTLVDGTLYNIKNGKALVDGTAYDISFGEPVTVTIKKTGTSSFGSVNFDGISYYDSKTLEVNSGTIITCVASYYDCGCGNGTSEIRLNGRSASPIYYPGDPNIKYFDYTVTSNVTIYLNSSKSTCNDCGKNYVKSYVDITEE